MSSIQDVEAQLAHVDKVRRRVVNVVGHALRTPVSTLRGLIDVLDRTGPSEAPADVVPALVRNTRTLERLLDGLLIVSEVDTAMPVDPPAPTGLADTVRQVWTELSVEDGRGWTDDELRIDGDATIDASEVSLRHLLWHLLDNAGKYGDRPVDVTITPRDGEVRLTIANPGRTPTDEELKLSDELFYRSEEAVTRTAGLGIGIPVSRRIAAHMGAELQLRARDQGGAIAELNLPSS